MTLRLGDVVRDVINASGVAASLKYPELYAAWQRTVGPEIAEHTRLWGFRRGVLQIAVDSSALMNEIEFHRNTLLQEMQREIRKPFISSLRFVAKPLREGHAQA